MAKSYLQYEGHLISKEMPKSQKDFNYKTGRTAQVIRRKKSRRHILHGTYHRFQNLANPFDNNLGNSPFLSGLKNGTAIGLGPRKVSTRAD